LAEIRGFEDYLQEQFGYVVEEEDPGKYHRRMGVIKQLDEEQQEAYYDATDVRNVTSYGYVVSPSSSDGEVTAQSDTVDSEIVHESTATINQDKPEKWGWDVPPTESVSSPDLSQKEAELEQNIDTGGVSTETYEVTNEASVGATVEATHWLWGTVYTYSYTQDWQYSYIQNTDFNTTYDWSVDDLRHESIGVDIQQTDYQFNGSTEADNVSNDEWDGWNKGEFEHNVVGSNNFYYPFIHLEGDDHGNGSIRETRTGR